MLQLFRAKCYESMFLRVGEKRSVDDHAVTYFWNEKSEWNTNLQKDQDCVSSSRWSLRSRPLFIPSQTLRPMSPLPVTNTKSVIQVVVSISVYVQSLNHAILPWSMPVIRALLCCFETIKLCSWLRKRQFLNEKNGNKLYFLSVVYSSYNHIIYVCINDGRSDWLGKEAWERGLFNKKFVLEHTLFVLTSLSLSTLGTEDEAVGGKTLAVGSNGGVDKSTVVAETLL